MSPVDPVEPSEVDPVVVGTAGGEAEKGAVDPRAEPVMEPVAVHGDQVVPLAVVPVAVVPVPAPAPAPAGEYRVAIVSAVTLDLPAQHPTVVLRETESPRRQLSFAVGLHDGIALSHALRRLPTPRPLTHELVTGILQGFDIDVVAIRLVGRQGSTYFAELDLRGRNGRSVLSCRPSDALAIALHQPVPVPILIDARLLELSTDVLPPGTDG